MGVYELLPFNEGISTDYREENGRLGLYYGDVNGGRLPSYHRMDLGAKRKISIGKRGLLEISMSITNVYSRKNIFYIERVTGERVNQLPILVCLGGTFSF
jgi:hypothetical protein